MMKRAWNGVMVFGALAVGVTVAEAASPQLTRVLPRGGQRGTEVRFALEGQRLADAQEVLVYQPGVTITKVEQPTEKEKGLAGKRVYVTAKIAPDARLGEYGLRLRTAGGLSEFRTFYVGAYPQVDEKEPNSEFKSPQAVALNVTVAGVIDNEDQDFFVVEAKKGQRLTAEIEGIRLGDAMFDPYVAILDENRFELSASDDTALLRQDSVASIVAPKDGKYIVQVRESSFGGSASSFYRLHVGTFPRPRIVYPLGGPAGGSVSVQFRGDAKGPMERNLKLPGAAEAGYELVADEGGLVAPSGNHFRVSGFPNVLEVEPDDTVKTATAYDGELPVAFNGIVAAHASEGAGAAHGDVDYFRFAAKKGQALDVNCYARRLRSPLDPVITVHDAQGRQVATNDDSGGPDSYLRFNVPADGHYVVGVRDHLHGGSPLHAYRIEITAAVPNVRLGIPQYTQQYSQERQAVTVHRGNRYATLVRATRQDVGGSLKLEIPDLPPGVKIDADAFEPGVDAVPVLFEAAADAKVGGKLVEAHVKAVAGADGKVGAPANYTSSFNQVVELVHGNPNNTPYYQTSVERMAVAVAEEAPYALRVIEPKVPLVQGGEIKLKVVAERKKGFDAPILARFLFRPPGIEAQTQVEIPAGKTEATYTVNASDGAALKRWRLAVVGSADANGLNWVSSQLAPLEVAAPFVTAKIANANVEQAQSTKVTADLDVKTRWEGKAKVELLGLPGGAAAEPKEITAGDKKVEFTVRTQKTTPPAAHNGLFVRVTVPRNGEEVVHNVGRGGLLRVDAPLKAETKSGGAKEAKPAKDAKDAKESAKKPSK